MKVGEENICAKSVDSSLPNSCIDQAASSVTIKDSEEPRYFIIFTLESVEADGRCKVTPVLVPFEVVDKINNQGSEAHGKMDGSEHVPSPIIYFNLQHVLRSPFNGHQTSKKQYVPKLVSRSNANNKHFAEGQNRATKRSADPREKKNDASNVTSGSPDPCMSGSINLVDTIPKVDNHVKFSKKKHKKKGKQKNRESSSSTSPTVLENKEDMSLSSGSVSEFNCLSGGSGTITSKASQVVKLCKVNHVMQDEHKLESVEVPDLESPSGAGSQAASNVCDEPCVGTAAAQDVIDVSNDSLNVLETKCHVSEGAEISPYVRAAVVNDSSASSSVSIPELKEQFEPEIHSVEVLGLSKQVCEHEVLEVGITVSVGGPLSVPEPPHLSDNELVSVMQNNAQLDLHDESNPDIRSAHSKDQEATFLENVLSCEMVEGLSPCTSEFPCNQPVLLEKENEDELALDKELTVSVEESKSVEDTPSESSEASTSNSSLDGILDAVFDAYTVHVESEHLQKTTGCLLAEFETVIHASSPLISARADRCTNGETGMGHPLCRHKIADLSLASVWKWYEEPGCYGLKVKSEDYQSSKRRIGTYESCAYFLPLLSAIQLFRPHQNTLSCRSLTSNPRVIEPLPQDADNMENTEQHSFSHFLPNLLENSSTSAFSRAPEAETLACWYTGDHDIGCNNVLYSCAELMFEFFESDRPQQRKPLHEKIKELARGEASPNSQVYGDPLCLESLALGDLHPASWYSVAWYPIYRIPEDSLRAAFLTYHSLGHFVKIPPKFADFGMTSISFPVVGLQCYNNQGEGWFSLKKSPVVHNGENPHGDPPKLLEGRLKTLSRSASLMSTASVCKGECVSVNNHPDYQFFCGRKW